MCAGCVLRPGRHPRAREAQPPLDELPQDRRPVGIRSRGGITELLPCVVVYAHRAVGRGWLIGHALIVAAVSIQNYPLNVLTVYMHLSMVVHIHQGGPLRW